MADPLDTNTRNPDVQKYNYPQTHIETGMQMLGNLKLHEKAKESIFSDAELKQMRDQEKKTPWFSKGIEGQSEFAKLTSRYELARSQEQVKICKANDMVVHVEFPYNGEPPKHIHVSNPITPNRFFYVRNHGNIPVIDVNDWKLEIAGLVDRPTVFTMQDLHRMFKQRDEQVTLQCAGNRRSGQAIYYPLAGDEVMTTQWTEQAIGNALWRGFSLKDILDYVGVKPEAKEIEFTGMDTVIKKKKPFNFCVSVPIHKGLHDEILLAFEMNGEPLPTIHGYPLRALVLGYIGARACKWLRRIHLRADPSPAPTQQKEYRWFPRTIGDHNKVWTEGMILCEWPVNSCIMSPMKHETIEHKGEICVAGWAMVGGPRTVQRVEVSVNGCWYVAKVYSHQHPWAWTLWRCTVPVSVDGPVTLACRAWDSSCNCQPADVSQVWNWKGYVNNSYHQVTIYSIMKAASDPKLLEYNKKLQETKIPAPHPEDGHK